MVAAKVEKSSLDVDTIVAPATVAGQSGVAIVRLSGDLSAKIAEDLAGFYPKDRHAHYTAFKDQHDQLIDNGILLYFKSPHSFTGEDVVEIQIHGSYIVLEQIISQCVAYGARYARAGEFSERAFLNNKIDLIQAEAIADLISSGSLQAAQAALRSLQGDFSKEVNNIQHQLTDIRKYIEAHIDFSDEDIDFLARKQIQDRLFQLNHQLQTVLKNANEGCILQNGLHVVLSGLPNAGKSTLYNQLLGDDAAIVTDIPGTTRDVLRQTIALNGLPIHLVDTAGMRDSDDVIEQQGVSRSQSAVCKADLMIWMIDISQGDELIDESLRYCYKMINRLNINKLPLCFLANKIDLCHEKDITKVDKKTTEAIEAMQEMEATEATDYSILFLSAKHDKGIKTLKEFIFKKAGWKSSAGSGSFSARKRHIKSLNKASQHVVEAINNFKIKHEFEIVAEDLRLAQLQLDELTGRKTSDDLLGDIFSSFCIGK